jgi:hypothetical protein
VLPVSGVEYQPEGTLKRSPEPSGQYLRQRQQYPIHVMPGGAPTTHANNDECIPRHPSTRHRRRFRRRLRAVVASRTWSRAQRRVRPDCGGVAEPSGRACTNQSVAGTVARQTSSRGSSRTHELIRLHRAVAAADRVVARSHWCWGGSVGDAEHRDVAAHQLEQVAYADVRLRLSELRYRARDVTHPNAIGAVVPRLTPRVPRSRGCSR